MIEPIFIMEVEFDHPELDWNVLFDDNLVDLAGYAQVTQMVHDRESADRSPSKKKR